MTRTPTLILASQSATRQMMLKNAGLDFIPCPANLDEEGLIEKCTRTGTPIHDIPQILAQEKALSLCKLYPDCLVIGADQILECEGQILSKAKNANEAQEKLRFLCGKTHSLISAVCVAKGGDVLWSARDAAHLTMQDFDEGFLQDYCARAGQALTRSVGAYELEGLGIHLFEKIEGDYFTILGLPLLPLLAYLRQAGYRSISTITGT